MNPDSTVPTRLTIENCARCGHNHEDLLFHPFQNPPPRHSLWALCPTNGEPIFAAVVTDIDPHPGHAPCPFCGHQHSDVTVEHDVGDNGVVGWVGWVKCRSCGAESGEARTPKDKGGYEACHNEALRLWDSRAAPALT